MTPTVPNVTGLRMHGNAWQWVEDCYHDKYDGAQSDGSAWTSGDCRSRVRRGAAWGYNPRFLRSASRMGLPADFRGDGSGFRVARTLTP
jgi:formylglycine-generating enzyme required for sulfatase activity